MIKYNFNDELFTETVDKMIATFLPNKEFDYWTALKSLRLLVDYIHVDEFDVPRRLLVTTARELFDLAEEQNIEDILVTEEYLDSVLSASLEEFIRVEYHICREFCETRGITLNLEIAESVQSAISLIYANTRDVYTRCTNLDISSKDFLSIIPALKKHISINATDEVYAVSRDILQNSVRVGRTVYRGPQSSREFVIMACNEIDMRLRNAGKTKVTYFDSMQVFNKIDEEAAVINSKICDWGIPQLDDVTPVLRSRISAIVANPNVGKTVSAINIAARALAAGQPIVYMRGESSKVKIKDRIISAYIKLKYNKFVSHLDVSNPDLKDKVCKDYIKLAQADIIDNNLLAIADTFSYTDLYNDLKNVYRVNKFALAVIDHSGMLDDSEESTPKYRRDSIKEMIDYAVKQSIRFKEEFPVHILWLSHLSAEGKTELKKTGFVSSEATAWSSGLERGCDEVMILSDGKDTDTYSARNIQIKKRRDGKIYKNLIIMRFFFENSVWMYDPSDQTTGCNDTKVEKAVENLKAEYGITEPSDNNDDLIITDISLEME